jgi:glycosyltransferase involved in cell wall biosynthesis
MISIVMPTYNQGKFIKEAINSILAQTYKAWELIIVDDASTDDTTIIAKQFLKDERIRYIRNEENKMTGTSLNIGFSKATGEYETWWASDNNMYPDMLEKLLNCLCTSDRYDHIYSNCDCGFMDETGLVESYKKKFSHLVGPMNWVEGKLSQGYYLGICWMWRRNLRLRCGEFQKEPCEDYDMALRMVEAGGKFFYLDEILGWQRRHSENLTNTVVDETGDPNAKTKFVQDKAKERLRNKSKFPAPPINKGSLKIAIINLEFDCAGVGWNLKKAIEKYTNHKCRHITRKITSFAHNTDFLLDYNNTKHFEEIIKWADVLHFNQWIWTHDPFKQNNEFAWTPEKDKPIMDYYKYFRDRKVIFHFHAGEILSIPHYYEREAAKVRAKIFTCDPPSELCVKGAKWMPNVLDFTDMPECGASSKDSTLRIFCGHGNADDRKNVSLYRRYVETLIRNDYKIDFDVIWGLDKEMSFRRRAGYHIAIESLTEGYIGMVGWEAMAMGQVVIARLAKQSVRRYADLGEPPPIINCDSASLMMKEIRELYDDRNRLDLLMEESKRWMKEFYSPEKIVDMYIKEYKA